MSAEFKEEVKSRLRPWKSFCVSQAQAGSRSFTPSPDWIWIYSWKKSEPACTICKEGEVEHLGMPFSFFLGLLTRPAVTCCAGAPWIRLLAVFHHVSLLLYSSGGLGSPSRVLLFGGKIPGGVENAASHGGDRDPGQEQRSLPAVLPRSSGETQLPQRSHLCVVGFPARALWAVCRGICLF